MRDGRRWRARDHIEKETKWLGELSDIDIALRDGDYSAFDAVVERHRRELQVHCYRMLGSFQDSEDIAQEIFLRAWANRSDYEGRSSFRAWLYRIATNACLDLIKRRRRVVSFDPVSNARTEVGWLEPFPDSRLPGPDNPAAATVARETIELAYIAAIQHLPPRQRAVLLLRDAIGWSANETAELLEMSVAAVNSALQRGRATLAEQARSREERTTSWQPTSEERRLLAPFMEATERADMTAMAQLLKEDAVFWMPPDPGVFVGRSVIIESWTLSSLARRGSGTSRWSLSLQARSITHGFRSTCSASRMGPSPRSSRFPNPCSTTSACRRDSDQAISIAAIDIDIADAAFYCPGTCRGTTPTHRVVTAER